MEAHKVTLSSKKVIYLREPKIADTETAATVAGKGNSDNQILVGIKLQKEMLKLLLVQVDDQKLTLTDKEQLDKWFSPQEYNQAVKVVSQLVGSEEGNEPAIEFVTFGDK
jgi:hypothetical protein